MKSEWSYIDVYEDTIRLGMTLGLVKIARDEEKEIYELTPKGSAWLDEWTKNELAIARCMAI